ncbi:citramalyl-CoA lyase, mitochondrial-like [Zophobas morio]|uniref:citramalyl-CoA lyase, mitochondrial-like n=1 Tax=Zophobas morio TaxID=2755281 RepID=UPI003082EE19
MFCNRVQILLKPIFNSVKTTFRKYTPRRAVLYAPADNLKKVLSTFMLKVDCIMLDCEDSVVLSHKSEARLNIRQLLDQGKPIKKSNYDFGVHMNEPHSELLKLDVSVIMTGKHVPDTICLPKVDKPSDVQIFADLLNEYVKSDIKVNLIISVESPESLVNLVEICNTAVALSKTSKFTLVGLAFGCMDYCVQLGVKISKTLNEVLYARMKVVTVAKAFHLQAIDMASNNYKNLEIVKNQAEEAAQLGYTGKKVFHKSHIEVVQEVFSPSKQDIALAQKIIKMFSEHQKEGKAYFLHKGTIIAMPMMRWAQHILELANAIDMKK